MKADPWIDYYVHDGSRILRTGHCPRSLLARQARKGQVAAEGAAHDVRDKIVEGAVVHRTAEEIAVSREIQPPPAPGEEIVTIRRKEWEQVLNRISRLEES